MNDNIVRPEFGSRQTPTEQVTEQVATPGDVIALAEKTDDNTFVTPEQMLRMAADEYVNGEVEHDKAFAVLLDTRNGSFHVSYRAANIKSSEMIAALECLKATLLNGMGYV